MPCRVWVKRWVSTMTHSCILERVGKVKCPYCGCEGEFKLLKMWRYRWWNVYFYECPNCGGKFRYQAGSKEKHRSYIIKLREYLQRVKKKDIDKVKL